MNNEDKTLWFVVIFSIIISLLISELASLSFGFEAFVRMFLFVIMIMLLFGLFVLLITIRMLN